MKTNDPRLNMAELILAFAKANPDEARRIFNARIADESSETKRVDLEIVREYGCNPAFVDYLKTL